MPHRRSMALDTPQAQRFPEHQPDRPPLLIGSAWMVGISLVLSITPMIGAFLGGLVGGWMVRTAGRAFFAALIGIALFVLLVGFIPYAGLLPLGSRDREVLLVVSAVAMLLGAFAGAAIAGSRSERRRRTVV